MDIQSAAGKIFAGNLLFAACCIVYLAWWCVAFRPGYSAPMGIKTALFAITAILGVAGLATIIIGCQMSSGGMRYVGIIAAGAAVYILLLVITNVAMHRQVTTELMLIVFWVSMEICACNALFGTGTISKAAFVIMGIIILVAAIIGMISYLKYYDLEPMPAFYDGMVPLVLFALVMIGIAGYIKMCH